LTDDYQPDCPACESEDIKTDWDAVVNRFGDPADASVEPLAGVMMPAREV
jgi:hypothetical protein